jgi:hypothetical protein
MPVRDDLEATALRIAARRRASLPLAPAVFIGVQEGWGVIPDSELYNLTAPIPDRTTGSTVTRETLEAAGYYVPARNAVSASSFIAETLSA